MAEYTFIRDITTINGSKLADELHAAIPDTGYSTSGQGQVKVVTTHESSIPEQTLLGDVIANHDPSLSAAQLDAVALNAAQAIALNQAKVYLRNQLRRPNLTVADVTTIYNTVRAYVLGDQELSRMMTNELLLLAAIPNWTLNQSNPAHVDRLRYLIAAKNVMALLG